MRVATRCMLAAMSIQPCFKGQHGHLGLSYAIHLVMPQTILCSVKANLEIGG
jgi:hypothetical protein